MSNSQLSSAALMNAAWQPLGSRLSVVAGGAGTGVGAGAGAGALSQEQDELQAAVRLRPAQSLRLQLVADDRAALVRAARRLVGGRTHTNQYIMFVYINTIRTNHNTDYDHTNNNHNN